MIKCRICDTFFNPLSVKKKQLGGYYNVCESCTEEYTGEDVPKYLGVASADGKFNQISILSFSKKEDREKYAHFWQNNSGLNKSKSCQLGKHLSTTPNVSFKSITQFKSVNHKGKQ